MPDYKRVWCLFCETGHEKRVAERIGRYGWGRAIFGEKVKVEHKCYGVDETHTRALLPGYVFVYRDDTEDAPVASRTDYLGLDGVIRVLTYGEKEKQQNDLVGNDLEFAHWLWRTGGRVEAVKAIRIGDRVEIKDPLFAALKGEIVRMDRRKRSVTLKLDSESGDKFITLSYEIVQEMNMQENDMPIHLED